MRTYHLAIMLIAMAFTAFSQYGDAVLAIVGKKVITFHDLIQITQQNENLLAKQHTGEELEKQVQALRKSTLDTMIEHELCYMAFQDLKAKVPTDYLQDRINEIVDEHANGNIAKFEEQLQKEGTNMKEFKERMEQDIAVLMIINEKTKRGNIVSEREIQEFYNAKKASMAVAPEYRISVIQLRRDGKYAEKLQETANGIYSKLKEGTPFGDLAKEYSEGAGAENGGDQGWMKQLNEALLAVVEKLAPGQTAMKPVELASSLYIVQLTEKKGGGVPPLDAALKEEIRKQITKDEEDKRYKAFIRELYMKCRVKRFDVAE